MDAAALQSMLAAVRDGTLSLNDALQRLKHWPYENLDFAKVDHHRALRCGLPEVIFCPGKTDEQIATIFEACAASGNNVMASRAPEHAVKAVQARCPDAVWHEQARAIYLKQKISEQTIGRIAVVTAGTADLPVAEEARLTAELSAATVSLIADVGVAGLHRLLAALEAIRQADVVIVVAGMEGALPSVVGGLIDRPIIAVPTSVGYGASMGGLTALLAMLNSCAAGVPVMNIDNGFGAAVAAIRILRMRG